MKANPTKPILTGDGFEIINPYVRVQSGRRILSERCPWCNMGRTYQNENEDEQRRQFAFAQQVMTEQIFRGQNSSFGRRIRTAGINAGDLPEDCKGGQHNSMYSVRTHSVTLCGGDRKGPPSSIAFTMGHELGAANEGLADLSGAAVLAEYFRKNPPRSPTDLAAAFSGFDFCAVIDLSENSTHPRFLHRFENAIMSNPELARIYGCTELAKPDWWARVGRSPMTSVTGGSAAGSTHIRPAGTR